MTHFNKRHGHKCGGKSSPTYQAWAAMKHRCSNKNNHAWHNYGGRGIQVCKRWRDSFEAFLEDVGLKPGKGYDLDRLNPNKGYCPGNVKWNIRSIAAENTRKTLCITINGVRRSAANWSRMAGLERHTVSERYARGIRGDGLIRKEPYSSWHSRGH